ncbi:putative ribosomal protein [Coemansia reversa NRRL 1564]|uniref:Putative ribosomal protein n=1 Tax=Coemansia reversa (strain ATCC 12441 / NRRL 1564) TaxID=763665 RepID=A0A2G5BG84_COERN|nr:putative ribosomal protein [Coemansia reversa NRRL 1564]|eukprot:PIA18011.1 putative ribosomal protein [Coemansia reversa NRRL 1564]
MVQRSFKRLVEVGRVVLITHGADAGKIATIVDIVDHNRAIIDGPTTGVSRQVIAYKNTVLTDIVVKRLPRTIGSKALAKFLEKEQVVEAWQKTAWAKKLDARKRRSNLSDFDRFKLMRLKKQQRNVVDRQVALLRKERA